MLACPAGKVVKNRTEIIMGAKIQITRFLLRSRVLLVMISTVLSLLIGELLLIPFKVFEPFPRYEVGEFEYLPQEFFIQDDQIGWKMKGTVHGFRGPMRLNPLDTHKKVVLVGDSFTWGSNVEYNDTFGAIIDEELSKVVVYNLAMPGFGVDQIWLTLRHKALSLKPDLIIVGICDADFKRSQSAYRSLEGLSKPAYKLVEGQLIRKTKADQMPQPFRFLERNSRIWMGGRILLRAIGYQVPFGEWWDLNEAILDEMRFEATAHDVPILFIYIPTVAWRSFPTLNNYMDRVQAHYLDLRGIAPSNYRELYDSTASPHFNRNGHRFVATRILDWMKTHRLDFFTEVER